LPVLPGLNCKARTAFGTAGIDDRATALGFHAYQKTVCALSSGDGRLICTFHGDPLDLKRAITNP
jgi:hypothetical protein